MANSREYAVASECRRKIEEAATSVHVDGEEILDTLIKEMFRGKPRRKRLKFCLVVTSHVVKDYWVGMRDWIKSHTDW